MKSTVTTTFYREDEDITVKLTTEDGNDYSYVIIGDANRVLDKELMQMTSGKPPAHWSLVPKQS